MGDLRMRDISDAMRQNIAVRAERRGRSLSDEANRLVQKGMIAEEPVANDDDLTAWDSLRSVSRAGERRRGRGVRENHG